MKYLIFLFLLSSLAFSIDKPLEDINTRVDYFLHNLPLLHTPDQYSKKISLSIWKIVPSLPYEDLPESFDKFDAIKDHKLTKDYSVLKEKISLQKLNLSEDYEYWKSLVSLTAFIDVVKYSCIVENPEKKHSSQNIRSLISAVLQNPFYYKHSYILLPLAHSLYKILSQHEEHAYPLDRILIFNPGSFYEQYELLNSEILRIENQFNTLFTPQPKDWLDSFWASTQQ